MEHKDLHRPLYTADVLANALNNGRDLPLLHRLDGPTLTVAQVRDQTSQFVQALASLGVGAGSRVSLIAPNIPECLHVTHALQMLAALYVPMHPLSALPDHVHVIRDAEVEILIFDAERFEGRAAEIAREIPGLRLLAIGESTLGDDIWNLASGFKPAPLTPPVVGPHDITRLGYSGGTTGKPKAIPSVQRIGALTGLYMQADWEWPAPPHILSCAPLTHAGGAMFIPALLRGGTFLILPRFDPTQVLEMIQERRINCMMLVPTMIYALLDHPKLDEYDLSSLETVFYGASAMSPARLKEAIERIGPVFAQFYGQAEAPMVLTYFRKADHDVNDMRRLASCGRPSPWVRLELHDADGNPVPDGEPGEICVQGPLVMDGYRDPELTAEAFKGGWLHTGDVAVRDPDGFLRIVDRTKDMIVSGGFNIYPRDIENIIAENPAVAEVAVIGVPDERWGEAVKAIIVLKPGASAGEDDIAGPVAAAKGSYQAPKSVDFVDSIPQTPVGKPDKKALRARYAETATA
ncbi:MAG: AMP-binding protein [Novosphingobium sp.]|nr:AMP-binding protein [Novosphingobium sp.]MCP5400950.1 AMP-binding protein [Novosphingobium sp.]